MKRYFTTDEILVLSKNIDLGKYSDIEDIQDPKEKEAFRNYIFLTENDQIDDILLRYYSRYFWFLSYVERKKYLYGEDAGLEQQLFKIIEEADSLNKDVDWEIIQEIENIIKQPGS